MDGLWEEAVALTNIQVGSVEVCGATSVRAQGTSEICGVANVEIVESWNITSVTGIRNSAGPQSDFSILDFFGDTHHQGESKFKDFDTGVQQQSQCSQWSDRSDKS